MEYGWERIYAQKGDPGFGVLPKIKRACKVFNEKEYHDLLDLGCGTGRHSIFLAQHGFSVKATDFSSTGIRIAQAKVKSLNLYNIHFVQHEMNTIPFLDRSFDAVICTWTIYHGIIASIRQTITEIHRVLKQNGSLITDFLSTNDSTYGLGHEVEQNTFVGQKPGEEDVPHHYSTKKELVELLARFCLVKIRQQSRTYAAEGREYVRKYFDVETVK